MSFSAASQTAKENPPKMQYGVYIRLHHQQNFVLIKISTKFSFLLPWSESCSVVSNSLQPHGLYNPWNSLGQNTGVGSLSLLQGIFPTQGSNPGLSHCRWILYQLSYEGSHLLSKYVPISVFLSTFRWWPPYLSSRELLPFWPPTLLFPRAVRMILLNPTQTNVVVILKCLQRLLT